MSLFSRLLVGVIRVYQLALSPVLPASCRYLPTCSAYACDAIARHGPLVGGTLALRRLLRCHPWGGMGYDPVPDATVVDHLGRASCGAGRGSDRR